MIELKNVSFTYPNMDHQAVKNVHLKIHTGEWISIIGPNGSGKSTLARLINGLLEADSGEIVVNGLIVDEDHIWEIRDQIGMVFQNPDNQFVGATVEDDVAFGMENRGIPRSEMIPRVQEALERVGMWQYKDREPSRLSGGQKQRVAIAGILAVAPKVIVLDEATSMLDPKGRKEILEIVKRIKKEQNLTVLSITHDIDETMLSDRIFIMESGEIKYSGAPKEIYSLGEDTLLQHELNLPFVERFKAKLAEQGVPVPTEYMSEERLAKWLWQYVLNK